MNAMLRTAALAASLLMLCAALKADTKNDDWDNDDDSLDRLIATARSVKNKVKADGTLDPRQAKAYSEMLKTAGRSAKPVPVVTAYLEEIYRQTTTTGGETKEKYPSLQPQTVELIKTSLTYLKIIGPQGEKAAAAVIPLVARKKQVAVVTSTYIPGSYNTYTRTYNAGYYSPTTTYKDAPEVRELAAEALGRMKSTKAVTPLMKAMKDDTSEQVRSKAALALGMIETVKYADLLNRLGWETSATVRGSLIVAGGNLGQAKAVPTILETLQEDKDDGVRVVAARTLGLIGGKRLTLEERKKLYRTLKTEKDIQTNTSVINAVEAAMKKIREAK